MTRIKLPHHLRTLAGVGAEVEIAVEGPTTQRAVLDALEAEHPMLVGTIRERSTGERRPFIRFFACGEDLSNADPDDLLPEAVVEGTEPYLIVGAMAGG